MMNLLQIFMSHPVWDEWIEIIMNEITKYNNEVSSRLG